MKSTLRHSMYLTLISAVTCLSVSACVASGTGDDPESIQGADEAVGEAEQGLAGSPGRIAYWPGKVNAHLTPASIWTYDTDCTSGSGILPLPYCQKYYPYTTSVTPVDVSKKPPLLWNTAGCGQQYSGNGIYEWTCNESPRIAYWPGKVNVHRDPGGNWTNDADCTSGSGINPLTYCQKFYPSTTSVTSVALSTKPALLWNTAGCGQQYSGNGIQEWTCDQ